MTHWRYGLDFQKKYPSIQFQDNILYTYDGQIGCSAGSASALDLSLEIIRQDYGYKVANQVAKRLVISPVRQGGQLQFSQSLGVDKPNKLTEVTL